MPQQPAVCARSLDHILKPDAGTAHEPVVRVTRARVDSDTGEAFLDVAFIPVF